MSLSLTLTLVCHVDSGARRPGIRQSLLVSNVSTDRTSSVLVLPLGSIPTGGIAGLEGRSEKHCPVSPVCPAHLSVVLPRGGSEPPKHACTHGVWHQSSVEMV